MHAPRHPRPANPPPPTPAATGLSATSGNAAAAIWGQRYDFRELLSAASLLSPDGLRWPEVPEWGYVHHRGLLEQGQDVALAEANSERASALVAEGGGSGAVVDGGNAGAERGPRAEAAREAVANPLRKWVAGDKSRYQEEDFDLNLTYITPRLIAMGLPAQSGLIQMTRNNITEVARFFETKHEGHYRIYNVCIEQYACYRAAYFLSGSVLHYPAQDHNPPPLVMVHHLALSVRSWLTADPLNVAAIHCKAGQQQQQQPHPPPQPPLSFCHSLSLCLLFLSVLFSCPLPTPRPVLALCFRDARPRMSHPFHARARSLSLSLWCRQRPDGRDDGGCAARHGPSFTHHRRRTPAI